MHEEESGITEAAHAAGAAIVARVTAPAAGMKKAPYGAFFHRRGQALDIAAISRHAQRLSQGLSTIAVGNSSLGVAGRLHRARPGFGIELETQLLVFAVDGHGAQQPRPQGLA